MGSCFFADYIVFLGNSAQELQLMLDVVAKFASRWHLHFNPKKCGMLVVGQKRRDKMWHLGNDEIKEVDEYKYLAVWVNRQATGHDQVKHLLEKSIKHAWVSQQSKILAGS